MKLSCRYGIVKTSVCRLLILFLIFAMPTSLYANHFAITQEAELTEKYDAVILPFWENQVSKLSFKGQENVNIQTAWVIHPKSRGSIVLSSGRTEAGIKYKELFYDLYQNGYSVFTLDHRGQGQSGRMLQNSDKGYVEDYGYFVADLHTFVEQRVLPNSTQKPKLLCHSMGCAIGALYLLSYPDTFSKVVFCSPMFGINTPIPQWLGKAMINTHGFFNTLFGDEPWYFPGQGDAGDEPFSENVVTSSEIRYAISERELAVADVALGGITTDWLKSSLWAMNYIKDNAKDIKVPALLLQSGADTVVDNSAQEAICNLMPDCILKTIKGARHELMIEKDAYRNPAISALLSFVAE